MLKKIVVGLVVILVAVFFTMVVGELRRRTPKLVNTIGGPECAPGGMFTASPIAPTDFLSITPLGNLSPPDHTVPTDHIYVVIKENNTIDPAYDRPVRAPGDIVVQSINHNTAKKQGAVWSDDYALDITACKDVRLNFGHVTSISPQLQAAFEAARPSCDTQVPRPGDDYTYCRAQLNYAMKAGEIIGTAGGGTATGLDIQAVDRRQSGKPYANPKRYRSDALHFVCPLDLFDEATKATLYEKLGSSRTKRTIEPRCGEVNQDVPGTAQGDWITGVKASDLIDQPGNWDKSIALVHDNFDPSVGIASIGGVIGSPTKIAFMPKHEGTINREFSEVKPDGTVYCYQTDAQPGSGNIARSGSLLIQLTNATTMQVELTQASCSGSGSFSKPTTYER
ncbi:MAG: hypothetical protein WAP74_03535 [Patescibacteria group bacterium]